MNTIQTAESLHRTSFGLHLLTVSPAFHKLNVPEPKKRKRCQQLCQKLPTEISGEEALNLLREREEKKQTEVRAKEERKREQEIKRKMKEKERERKKKKLEAKKLEKQQKKKSRKDDSDTDTDNQNIPYMDSDSSDFEESFLDAKHAEKEMSFIYGYAVSLAQNGGTQNVQVILTIWGFSFAAFANKVHLPTFQIFTCRPRSTLFSLLDILFWLAIRS